MPDFREKARGTSGVKGIPMASRWRPNRNVLALLILALVVIGGTFWARQNQQAQEQQQVD